MKYLLYISLVGLLVISTAACTSIGERQHDIDIQHCKVYGLKAYQEANVKKFKEIRISDCTDATQREVGNGRL